MCIVTGPRIELAITLIDRMKELFTEADSAENRAQTVNFDTKETIIKLNSIGIDLVMPERGNRSRERLPETYFN